jgi:hypothetical protein
MSDETLRSLERAAKQGDHDALMRDIVMVPRETYRALVDVMDEERPAPPQPWPGMAMTDPITATGRDPGDAAPPP